LALSAISDNQTGGPEKSASRSYVFQILLRPQRTAAIFSAAQLNLRFATLLHLQEWIQRGVWIGRRSQWVAAKDFVDNSSDEKLIELFDQSA